MLAMSSVLVNQQFILHKVSLNRNIHQTRLCIDPLMKMLWSEAHSSPTLFPQNSCSPLTNAVSYLLYRTRYSTWNSAQCYVAAWMGGEFGGGWVHVYVWLSPFAVHLKQSTLLTGYTQYKIKVFFVFFFFFKKGLLYITRINCNYTNTSFYCASQILQFFTNWNFVATLPWTSLPEPFFQQHWIT